MSKVRDLMQALKEDGFMNVDWAYMAGGCYAVRLSLGDPMENDFSEFLISNATPEPRPHGYDVAEPFGRRDLDDDDRVSGIWWLDRYNELGESETDGNGLIRTADTAVLIRTINDSLEAS
jgi:hypothetical protein